MKIFKKLLSAVLASTMVIGMSIGAFANNDGSREITIIDATETDDQIPPIFKIYDVCSGGNHIMESRGFGKLYKGSKGDAKLIYRDGCAWQCKNCNLVLITHGDPLLGQKIGDYADWSIDYDISLNGTILYTNDIHHCNSSKLDGYDFRRAIF